MQMPPSRLHSSSCASRMSAFRSRQLRDAGAHLLLHQQYIRVWRMHPRCAGGKCKAALNIKGPCTSAGMSHFQPWALPLDNKSSSTSCSAMR
eukprot:1149623-Pelagomonas_calceolata.AAC.1